MGMGSGNEEGPHLKTKINVRTRVFISNKYRLIENDRSLLRNKQKNKVAQIY